MALSDKYVQRVIDKYNRHHVIAFVQKGAERRFLSPLGLSLKRLPPVDFGDNCNRLDRSEEFELFAALHYMKYKITKNKNRRGCKDRYLQIYIALRNRAISANWPLVPNCVKRHAERFRNWLDKAQLIERGYMSLIYAADGFDPWRGFRFITYACNAITRSFFNRDQITRIMVSIDDGGDIGHESPDENCDLWLERLDVALRSDHLTSKEKKVLRYRFHDKLTLQETGDIWGVTNERIRQIQVKAIAKLKEGMSKDPILL